MKYRITNVIEKEWNSKPFKEASLINEEGVSHKVSAWAGEFDNKTEIECDLEKNDKGFWKLVTKKAVAGANFKTAQIEKSMERKESSIGKFQDNKEWSIMTSSTMRDAVLLAIAEIKDIKTLNTLEQDILKWRNWLVENWDLNKTDKAPF